MIGISPYSISTRAEKNYGHIEKEDLALVFAVKKFHHYLFGHRFTMMTGHKPLLGLFAVNKGIPDRSAARIARWALMLSGYDYNLVYRPGTLNGNADGNAEGEESYEVFSVHMMELANTL